MTKHHREHPPSFSRAWCDRRTSAILAPLVLLTMLLAACGSAGAPATTSPPAAAAGASASPSATTAAAPAAATAAPPGGSATAATPGTAQGAPAIKGSLTVFAAASLTDAFKEMKAAIEGANPGTTVTYNFGGSPTLRTQLAQGARADVFASADEQNMQGAQQDGTIAGQPRVFAQNKLTVIVPSANPAGISGLHDLSKPGLKLVLAQKDVPVGNYARQALNKMSADPSFGSDFSTKVLANLKSEEANVKDVVSKVQLGEADTGIVYLTDVTPAVRGAVKMVDIPDQFNVIARYPIAIVKGAPNDAGARAFIDYVLSPAGQAVLAKYGFAPAPAQAAASQGSAGGGAGPSGGGVALGGQLEQPGTLTVAALQRLPAETVDVTFLAGAGQEKHSFTGTRLATVLQQFQPKLDPSRKNDKLRHYVVATGRDGYQVVVAWGELDPDFANAPILLAWADNGQPLSAQDGPIRLVVPTDRHGGRYVSGLARLDVRSADSSPS